MHIKHDWKGIAAVCREHAEIRVRAASLADRRADLARVHVHDRFSEEREAGAILKGVLAVG